MAATKAEVVDGAQEGRVADVKEILVRWDAGASITGIAHSLAYSRPTVRKYVQAGQRVGLVRGSRRVDEVDWERAACAAITQVAAEPRVGDATLAIAAYHEHLAERVGSVRLSVLHQRLRDEQQLKVSWASFYRYARRHWPERLRPSPRIRVRLDDPPPGEEAQIDYFYVACWVDPETEHRHRVSMAIRFSPVAASRSPPLAVPSGGHENSPDRTSPLVRITSFRLVPVGCARAPGR